MKRSQTCAKRGQFHSYLLTTDRAINILLNEVIHCRTDDLLSQPTDWISHLPFFIHLLEKNDYVFDRGSFAAYCERRLRANKSIHHLGGDKTVISKGVN